MDVFLHVVKLNSVMNLFIFVSLNDFVGVKKRLITERIILASKYSHLGKKI